jgi:hypothetical protein
MSPTLSQAALCAALLALAAPAPAWADGATYNDDGMHFEAPAGFEKVDLPPADPTGSDDSDEAAPLAAFVYHRGQADQRAITISVARFDGPVEKFADSHVGDERKNDDGSFVAKNERTTLQNGMPAYYVRLNSGDTAGKYVQRAEYLVCDGTRSIDVAYVGPQDSFNDAQAKAALASLYVVVYPKHRV